MSDQTWSSWRYGPDGEAAVYHSAAEVPEGWSDRQNASHDPAGSDAGPPKAAATLGEARKAYKARFGKGASPKWSLEVVNAKLAED